MKPIYICLVACCFVFLIGMLLAYMIVRKEEQEHIERMKKIKRKEQA